MARVVAVIRELQVRDLARLSLKDPEYVAVHEQSKHATPKKLVRQPYRECLFVLRRSCVRETPLLRMQTQNYVVCPLENKINLLYSFVKTHLKCKVGSVQPRLLCACARVCVSVRACALTARVVAVMQTIVFVSSCKEAKYLFEVFRRMRPGVPLCALHGRIKQTKRMFVYYDFVSGAFCGSLWCLHCV